MAKLSISISRRRIVGTRRDGTTVDWPANLILDSHRGKPLVAGVGCDVAELRWGARQGERPFPPLVEPGQNEWWDVAWRWPRMPVEVERALRPRADGSSVLVIHPLSRETWAPHLAGAMFRYVLADLEGGVWLRSLGLGPRVTVTLGDHFDEIERGELLDALADAWGARSFSADGPHSPRPVNAAAAGLRRLRYAEFLLLTVIFASLPVIHRCWPGRRDLYIAFPAAVLVPILAVRRRQEHLAERVSREAPRREGV
jgi:hypothetical protein